jgi:hypothetical protein
VTITDVRCIAAVLLLAAAWSGPAEAQDTRAEVIAEQQAQKAKSITRYTPTRAERIFERIERGRWFTGGLPKGIYPAFDSVYPGGGFTLGAGYRKYTGYSTFVDVHGMYSLKNYKLFEAGVGSTQHGGGRLDVGARLGWRDATQVGFYGLGMDTSRGDRANFRINQTYVEADVVVRPARWLTLNGLAGYDDYREGTPQGGHPAIQDVYDPAAAPLLGVEPGYVKAQGTASLLWMASPGYSRTGGRYRLAYQAFNQTRGGDGRFGLVRSELVQHVPLLRETWVLSLRARTDSVASGEDDVPYFLLPSLGGGSTLRGYSTARFRDRHAMLLTAEWRWIPNRLGLDMALFADAGKVAPRFGDLDFSDLKTDYGIGIRFHAPAVTILRVELARGDEGWRTVFAAAAPF